MLFISATEITPGESHCTVQTCFKHLEISLPFLGAEIAGVCHRAQLPFTSDGVYFVLNISPLGLNSMFPN